VVWRRLCVNDVSRFFVLNICAFGLVFSQMEEPGYMLYVTSLIGIIWQEHQCEKRMNPGETVDQLLIPTRRKSIKAWINFLLRKN
jgi:hypothetical protein